MANSDKHQLTAPQWRERIEATRTRVEQVSALRQLVASQDIGGNERVWLLATIDARRVGLVHAIGRYERFIETLQEQERERREEARRETLGVVFIDGERVEI